MSKTYKLDELPEGVRKLLMGFLVNAAACSELGISKKGYLILADEMWDNMERQGAEYTLNAIDGLIDKELNEKT